MKPLSFSTVGTYTHVLRWVKDLEARPAVPRGRRVNKSWGPEEERLIERHSARDFDKPVRARTRSGYGNGHECRLPARATDDVGHTRGSAPELIDETGTAFKRQDGRTS